METKFKELETKFKESKTKELEINHEKLDNQFREAHIWDKELDTQIKKSN